MALTLLHYWSLFNYPYMELNSRRKWRPPPPEGLGRHHHHCTRVTTDPLEVHRHPHCGIEALPSGGSDAPLPPEGVGRHCHHCTRVTTDLLEAHRHFYRAIEVRVLWAPSGYPLPRTVTRSPSNACSPTSHSLCYVLCFYWVIFIWLALCHYDTPAICFLICTYYSTPLGDCYFIFQVCSLCIYSFTSFCVAQNHLHNSVRLCLF